MMTDISLTNHFNRANWTPYIALYAALYAKHCQHTPNNDYLLKMENVHSHWRICDIGVDLWQELDVIHMKHAGCHTHGTTWMSYTWNNIDVIHMKQPGCHTHGTTWMSYTWNKLDVIHMKQAGCHIITHIGWFNYTQLTTVYTANNSEHIQTLVISV